MRIKRGAEPWNGSVQWMPTVFYALPVPAIRGRGRGGRHQSPVVQTAGSTQDTNVEAVRCIFSVLPCTYGCKHAILLASNLKGFPGRQ